MGTYGPVPNKIVDSQTLEVIERTILKPTIEGMNKEGFPFVGCLFTGFMLTKNGPRVLEYNVRFGDPETQTLLSLMDSDLAVVLQACVEGKLDQIDLNISSKSAATVVMVAGGYPGSYKSGIKIEIAAKLPENVVLFHAGTKIDDLTGEIFTAGGRVIASTAVANTLAEAVTDAYKGVKGVSFEGMQYRTDIGARALS